MWYFRDVLYAVLYVRVSCYVVCVVPPSFKRAELLLSLNQVTGQSRVTRKVS